MESEHGSERPRLRTVDKRFLFEGAKSPGLIVAEVDCEKANSKATLIAELARALQFPDYFGGGWDAVSDCLQDLPWLGHASSALVIFSNSGRLEAIDSDFRVLLDILHDAAEAWKSEGFDFAVVLAEGKVATGDSWFGGADS